MSVHGEFERYVRAMADALRATGDPALIRHAEHAETVALASREPLADRADALLSDVLAAGERPAGWPPAAAEPTERVIAIARIILGR